MKRVIRLTESDLTRLIKRVVSEAVTAPEPVTTNSKTVKVYFLKEGEEIIDPTVKEDIKDWLRPIFKASLPTLKQFYNNTKYRLPKFITIGSATTSAGGYVANQKVAQGRINSITEIVVELLEELGTNAEMIQRLITTNSNYTYKPTSVDANFSDRSKVKPLDRERYAYVTVKELETVGLGKEQIGNIEDALLIARGYNINPDEVGIAKAICKLQTYSDIQDLNYELRNSGGLQGFINQTITDGFLSFDSDVQERVQIKACLNRASRTSNKGDIAAIAGDKLTIIIKK
jgi:hypothetical protein